MNVLGVVMAGGRNVRFGDLKAFAKVHGEPIIDRVVRALDRVADDVVIIANDQAAYAPLGLSIRSDETTDGGPLAGLLTALKWAKERKCDGVLTVACDMPFASAPLLRTLAETAAETKADAVLPESGGKRGVEPLCAYYSTNCIRALQAAIERGDYRMIAFHDDVRLARLALSEVQSFGDPETLFMNVNTPDELADAEARSRLD
jgi:molybdopterin-guanine dinucleotide biosynthesis protein A